MTSNGVPGPLSAGTAAFPHPAPRIDPLAAATARETYRLHMHDLGKKDTELGAVTA
jgi:hypothetical protein